MKVKVQTKVTLSIILILLVSAIITTTLCTKLLLSNTEEELEKNLLNIGGAIAQTSFVCEELKSSKYTGETQELTNNILKETADIDFIVVCDMNSIRYSHPNKKLIGTVMVGGDELEVVSKSKKYVSTTEGTLGLSIRGFVPIFDKNQDQVGYVVVGAMHTSFRQKQQQLFFISIIFLISGLLVGGISAIILSKNIKNILLGMEPEELAQLYREHRGMTEVICEGIVAIDQNGKVSLINESARRLLGIENANVKGLKVESVIPNTRLHLILSNGQAEYNREQVMNGKLVITNRIPIIEKNKVVGAVATFRDKTQLIHLGEELTGAKQMVQALRANTHEFSNKLHVVMGLLEIGEVDRAKSYIMEIDRSKSSLVKEVMKNVQDPVIAGLILGKIQQCKEQNVELKIYEDSYMKEINDNIICHSLVTIIGNLMDNALESVKKNNEGNRWIKVFIYEEDKIITIKVEDNGTGITDADKNNIFKRGFSTKGNERGTGLYLVQQALNNFQGNICVDSIPNVNTTFTVKIPFATKEEE